jgi:hypothetical protein
MLVHQLKALRAGRGDAAAVPSINGIIDSVNRVLSSSKQQDDDTGSGSSTLPVLNRGDWMTLEHIIRYFQADSSMQLASGFDYFIFERIERRQALVAKLEEHLTRHNSLIIAEGAGMIFCIGGLRHCAPTPDHVQLYILDPHGPPSAWSGNETDEPFRFKGGCGWIGFDSLLFGTCLDEFFAAFPERKIDHAAPISDGAEEEAKASKQKQEDELYADVMEVCGGWRFLFIHPALPRETQQK